MAANKKRSTTATSAPKRKPRGPTIKQRKAAYDRFNRDWAEKILAHPEKQAPYMVTTARNVLMRVEDECQTGPQKTLPLTIND